MAKEDIPIQGGHPQQPQSHYVEIPFAEDLRDLGVTKLGKYGDMIQVHLNRGKQTFYFPVDRKDIQKTLKYFQSAAEKSGGLSPNAITEMEGYLLDPSKGYAQYLQPEKKTSSFRYGYSNKDENGEAVNYAVTYNLGKDKIYEAVKIGDANIFLEVEKPLERITTRPIDIKFAYEITLPESEGGGKVLPLPIRDYISTPYEFKSKQEFDRLVAEVSQYKTPEPLYYEIKKQWMHYSKFGDEHNTICAADTVFSYLQDKLALTHYLLFHGPKNSGKTTNLYLFKALAYRNIMSTNTSYAAIYSLAGSGAKEGSFTLSDNEVVNLDIDLRKLQVLKDSYQKGISNYKVEISNFGRSIQKLNAYCLKVFSLEKFPVGDDIDGFLQRCIPLACQNRIQKLDIVRVLEPTNAEHEKLYGEIRLLRNKLLIYRMLHYFDEIPNVELNIPNREAQLYISLFLLFQNTKYPLKELEAAATKYIRANRERQAHTFEAVVYRAVKFLADQSKTNEIRTIDIWNRLQSVLDTQNIDGHAFSFECGDFGTVTLMRVLSIVKEILVIKPLRDRGNRWESIRGWEVDKKQLENQYAVFNPNTSIEVAITTNNTPKTRPGFSTPKASFNKIKKIEKGVDPPKSLAGKSAYKGSNGKPQISKKRRQSK
jgi:hypothetical protein